MNWIDGMVKPKAPPSGASVRSVNYSSSPLLASKTPPWRSKFLVAMVGLGFCALLGRAVYVQIVGAPFFLKQGEIRYARTLELPASRGRIIDRNGLILAASVPAPSLWAIPKDFDADKFKRRELARLLAMTPKELDVRLDDNPNFVWLRRQVEDPVAKDVLALNLKGVHQVREYKRKYPEGEAAAHVVGFTNIEDHGQEGIELAFQKDLSGRDGTRRVIKDRLGRVVEDIGDSVAPVDGRDIELAIDSKVQFFAYQRVRDAVAEHKAKAGSVVVLDAQSGEVLALANYPSFTPADRRNLSGAQLRNRALTDTFEPGSTMKPFIAAWAMESGRVTPNTVIQTAPGFINITGSTIRDAHPHGALTVAEVIQKSSNVGTVKMAMQMQPREMWELFTQVGFGQKPQIAFPGAVTGRLRPYKTWRPIEQATMSYGYGLSTSLFQLARAYAVFAHDGELLPASMVKNAEPAAGIRVISPKTAQAIREMLHMVTAEGGTAPKAQAMGYSVGGKTGTAYKQEGKGYAEKKYRAWFVGMAPIQNPRIVVAVMVDEPSAGKYFGGDVAAPVFSEVVQQTLRTLGVPPDLEVRPQIVAHTIPAEEESF
ncbi:peptidoglycan D,D-transpeptidase FtsI family protein [Piscinibacter sp.]|jgi:cell division protein FtsI (penicillin-binding protein 3)|uniref:peptidoglycan D,D-transpeptidase FtsI family protein n=1 Tax=Piscinibacter sp. TaxID=1903157 RepID=UPI002F412A18